jgi:hypothetical protein
VKDALNTKQDLVFEGFAGEVKDALNTKQDLVFAGQVHFPILDSRLVSLAFSFVQSRSRS